MHWYSVYLDQGVELKLCEPCQILCSTHLFLLVYVIICWYGPCRGFSQISVFSPLLPLLFHYLVSNCSYSLFMLNDILIVYFSLTFHIDVLSFATAHLTWNRSFFFCLFMHKMICQSSHSLFPCFCFVSWHLRQLAIFSCQTSSLYIFRLIWTWIHGS